MEGAVLASGETVAADLVVDASGRAGRTAAWLADAGLGPVAERSSGCGLIYYSRHFQRRDGLPDPPYASVLAGPRGDLGFVAYAIFLGDNRSFALIFMAPPGDRAFRALRHPDAYLRAARLLPGVAPWIDPDAAVPVTPVLPFGQVTNTIRQYVTGAGPVVPGLQPVGDALCHLNPSFAFGASMALHQAFTLADLLAVAADHHDLARRFDAAVGEDLRDRYRAVTAEDRDRARLVAWRADRRHQPGRQHGPVLAGGGLPRRPKRPAAASCCSTTGRPARSAQPARARPTAACARARPVPQRRAPAPRSHPQPPAAGTGGMNALSDCITGRPLLALSGAFALLARQSGRRCRAGLASLSVQICMLAGRVVLTGFVGAEPWTDRELGRAVLLGPWAPARL